MALVFFLILFVSLFLLSRVLTETISSFLMRVTRNYGITIQCLAIVFLPGVIIHELAHWLLASMVFVPTGDIEFLPQVQEDEVKLGSVQIARTDPIRRFIIGIAPSIFGLAVLWGIFWLFMPTLIPFTWKTAVFLYAVFEIGNTMFSSKKDIEGIMGFFILSFLFVSLLVFLRLPVFAFVSQLLVQEEVQSIFSTLDIFFLFALGIDVAVIGFFRLLLRFR